MSGNPLGFDVTITDENGAVIPAGLLVIGGGPSRYVSEFKASQQLLDSRIELLPSTLKNALHGDMEWTGNCISRIVVGNRPASGIPFVFEDALPDAWGRAILARHHGIPRHRVDTPAILQVASSLIGAISFNPINPEFIKKPAQPGSPSLHEKIEEANAFASDTILSERQMGELALYGSPSGGAQPKVIESNDDGHWIVKPSPRNGKTFPMPRAEAWIMAYARTAIGAADSWMSADGNLFVKRFDIKGTGRCHMTSLRSLLETEDTGYGTYMDIHDRIMRITSDSIADRERLFKLMVINVAIGNIDDHLKNFSVTWTGSEGWRLSPAYDITPAVLMMRGVSDTYHAIGFEASDAEHVKPDWARLKAIGEAMGFPVATSASMVDEIVSGISSHVECIDCYMPAGDHQDALVDFVTRNLSLLKASRPTSFRRR